MTNRRLQGQGSIDCLGPGRYWARLPRSMNRESLGVFPTEEEARAALAMELGLRTSRGQWATGGVTFAKCLEGALVDRELDGIRGVAHERRLARTHLETAPFAAMPITRIQPVDLADWLRKMGQKQAADGRGRRKLSRGTIKHALSLASAVFNVAIERGIRPDNPCRVVKVKTKDHRTEEVWTFLTLAEQNAIRTCDGIPLWARLMMAFAWGTGLRQGEQWNLELRDLHVKGDEPHAYVRYGSPGKPPKSGKPRSVPLFGVGLWAAREWIKLLPTYAPENPHGLVFPGPSGARRTGGAPSYSFKERDADGKARVGRAEWLPAWLEASGIGRPVRWHDLRHTCASSLISGFWGRRWTLEEVKELLGHSSITVTQKYAHLADTSLKAAARATGHATDAYTVG